MDILESSFLQALVESRRDALSRQQLRLAMQIPTTVTKETVELADYLGINLDSMILSGTTV